MKNLTNQQKGSLLAFVAVLFITPDSLFIRLSSLDTWGLVFYRGIIPFFTVLLGMLIIYRLNFFKILFTSGYHGIFYVITFSVTNITFVVSIQNTNVANTLVMIATAPMLSAILGAIFLKEPPDKKTWISIIITFLAIIYIFYDSLKLGNFYGDILGFVTAIGLAVGAVIGSNIANLILIMAATSFLVPIENINQNQINQAWMNISLAIILILMSFFLLPFNYLYGFIALLILFLTMFIQVKKGVIDVSDISEKRDYSSILSIVFIILGIFLLIYGSDLFVNSAIEIANNLNIPEAIIGISLVAFGTSLPELAVGILAAIRRKVDFALGNVLGSNIYNVLGVLGISSFFGNFTIPKIISEQDLYFMLFVTIMVLGFMFFIKKIGRTYGSIGLVMYFSYIFFIYN